VRLRSKRVIKVLCLPLKKLKLNQLSQLLLKLLNHLKAKKMMIA